MPCCSSSHIFYHLRNLILLMENSGLRRVDNNLLATRNLRRLLTHCTSCRVPLQSAGGQLRHLVPSQPLLCCFRTLVLFPWLGTLTKGTSRKRLFLFQLPRHSVISIDSAPGCPRSNEIVCRRRHVSPCPTLAQSKSTLRAILCSHGYSARLLLINTYERSRVVPLSLLRCYHVACGNVRVKSNPDWWANRVPDPPTACGVLIG